MGPLKIFLSLFIINYSLLVGEIRYVSHSGSSTPPYLTWETAADSIMSAINVSSFGDTIYVANGVYEEQVVMIPGLSLIGAGMDSCVIDTRALVNSYGFTSVNVAKHCLLSGFHIEVYFNTGKAYGLNLMDSSIVSLNKISNGGVGAYTTDASPIVKQNIFDVVALGLWAFNSNAIIRNNIIFTDPNSTASIVAGIDIEAFDYSYKPRIDSNLIFARSNSPYNAPRYGIHKSFGADPIISNNTIVIEHSAYSAALFLSYADSAWVYNNLMYGRGFGIDNEGVDHLFLTNNYIGSDTLTAIIAGPNSIIRNNIIANATKGIEKWSGYNPPTVKYNCFWNNDVNFSGFSNTDTTNIYQLPMIVNGDSTRGELNFHLQAFSPLIDRGDPDILDKDGTRSDIGLYGGPFGESYFYQDLPPRVPVNLTASVDTDYIVLSWNRNTEADFSHYNLYRDTTENFTADSTTFVASLEDTFYLHIRPEGINNLYFKLTAEDNQGNVSEPSEELHIVLTGTKSNEEFTINSYKLFQNYPNPFNPTTKIAYRLKERGYIKMYVYDIKGELVETLVNQYQEGGYHEVEFTGKVTEGSSSLASNLASGIYICQIMVRGENNIPVFTDIKKMILLK